jgi:hypothetical protein
VIIHHRPDACQANSSTVIDLPFAAWSFNLSSLRKKRQAAGVAGDMRRSCRVSPKRGRKETERKSLAGMRPDAIPSLLRGAQKPHGRKPMKLIDEVRHAIRVRHFSYETEQTYVYWIEDYIRFVRTPQGWRHPKDLGTVEVTAYLTHLAAERDVAASTQNVAFNALSTS